MKLTKMNLTVIKLNELVYSDLVTVYGGGPVWRWLGKVVAYIDKWGQEHTRKVYEQVMVDGEIIAD